MKIVTSFLLVFFIFMSFAEAQKQPQHKIAVYQIFTRLFTNQNTANKFNGTLAQNGVGKFNTINHKALASIKELGISHVWYTGVIEHATMSDFSASGISKDHPQVVKGIAGSPYSIKDYYDVNPDLAVDVKNRMSEFEALIERTHAQGLKVIIDFVPNHVARQYKSDNKPLGTKDFGETDNTKEAFSNQNNFYYLPNHAFKVPAGVNPPVGFDEPYYEFPAKATGNDVFSASPSVNDWFEAVKLNYGVDYLNGKAQVFDPIPDTWLKMEAILSFWAEKGVDGFRCDMAEMVPVAFWSWAIPQVKAKFPHLIFIAEIYNPSAYRTYLFVGKFDYLYDKVGLYDALRRLIEGHGNAMDITKVWQNESGDFSERMLRFLENHDEQRIASDQFGKTPASALAAMMLSATLHTGPVMVYFGQELGVKPIVSEGFQGNDGRTTIFDYWGITELQDWIKDGEFDANNLPLEKRRIRDFYKKTLWFAQTNPAISQGGFHDLQYLNAYGRSTGYDESKVYAYLRQSENQTLLFVYNFSLTENKTIKVKLPTSLLSDLGVLEANQTIRFQGVFDDTEMIKGGVDNLFKSDKPEAGLEIKVKANSFRIFEVK
jgi:glycosidase